MKSQLFYCLAKIFLISRKYYFEYEISLDDPTCLRDLITGAEMCATPDEVSSLCPEVRFFFASRKEKKICSQRRC